MKIPDLLDSKLPNATKGMRVTVMETGTSLLSATCALIAMAALLDLAVRAAFRFNWEHSWDSLYWHVPFAALRTGIPVPFELSDELMSYYQAYPPLADLFQGVLWKLTGSVTATQLACYLSFIVFLGYCHRVLRARFWLVGLIALTAPMVVIHATNDYIDLIGNSFLAIALSSFLYVYLFPDRSPRAALLGGVAGLIAAAWSKYQMVPLVAVGFLLLPVVGWHRIKALNLGHRKVIGIFVVAALLAALPYLHNLIAFGNPIWPYRIPVLGDLVPYSLDPSTMITSNRPPPFKDYGSFRLFFHSLFEIDHPTHYAHRPRWITDQSQAFVAYRMGGFWGVGAITYLLAAVAMLVAYDRKRGTIASLALLGMLCFVAFLPQSHESRYYLFIPLCWGAAIGMVFPNLRAALPRVAFGFLLIVLGLFGYMVSENLVHYRMSGSTYADAARAWEAPSWWARFEPGRTYCAVDVIPMSILLTGPTMSEYRIVDRSKEALCPPGSTVVRGYEPLLSQSLALYNAGKYQESIAASRKMLEITPGLPVAFNNICAAFNSMGRWNEAIDACTKAIELKPDFDLAKNNLAWAQKMNAAPEMERARAFLNESLALFKAGKYKEAIETSRKALEVAPNLPEAFNNICAAYNAIAMWDEGIAACTRAIELKPDFELARNNLAWATAERAAKK